MIYEYNRENVEELIMNLTENDIVQMHADEFLSLVGKSGKPKGRKPIAFDEDKFYEVINRWQSGFITARAAMNELNLKPNTFYRRVKEYTDMKDIKEIKKAIKEDSKELKAAIKNEKKEIKEALKAEEMELKANLKAEKEEMKELKAQVKTEAKDFKKQLKEDAKEVKKQLKEDAKDVENTISLKKMEKEIRWEKYEAEAERDKEIVALELEVAAETEAYKNNR